MKKIIFIALCGLFVVGCAKNDPKHPVVAKDGSNDIMRLSIQDALNSDLAKQKLDGSVKFVFGSGANGDIIRKNLVANKKTNGVGKDDVVACQRAFISALMTFQERAKSESGSKAINLVSYFKKKELNSKTEFECAVGNIMVGVALKGDIAK
ncbi:excinuclease ABC subunit A [Campylobacter sp. 9BO]|uniref:excinuclease ABC subunit A n=1 Tax=Campylobacter sp. 9BO TaxID=3424759 RepID=UPI003D34EEF9